MGVISFSMRIHKILLLNISFVKIQNLNFTNIQNLPPTSAHNSMSNLLDETKIDLFYETKLLFTLKGLLYIIGEHQNLHARLTTNLL